MPEENEARKDDFRGTLESTMDLELRENAAFKNPQS